jgi:hypothetical protein
MPSMSSFEVPLQRTLRMSEAEKTDLRVHTTEAGRSAFPPLQLAAPVLMMLDAEVGSTVWADVAMAVMLGLRLPDVVFGRERKLLRWHRDRRRDVGLRGRHREWRRRGERETVALLDRNPALVEIAFGARLRSIATRVAEGCACRNHDDRPNRRLRSEDFRPRHLDSDPAHTGRYSAGNKLKPVPVDSTTPKGVATSPQQGVPAPEWRLADAVRGGVGRILVGCRRSGSDIRIDVHDTGIGIPDEQMPKIFEAFARLDSARCEGLGICLFIVRQAIGLLGYRIDLASTLAAGPVFPFLRRTSCRVQTLARAEQHGPREAFAVMRAGD